jgi:hypothetical protein
MNKAQIDDKLHLVVRVARKYMQRHNLTPEQFLEHDREYDVLQFLALGYEPYHLTGDEGILEEIDRIVDEQRAASPQPTKGPRQLKEF